MQTKLFIGTRLTPDLKARLEDCTEKSMQVIPFEGKEFVGSYVAVTNPTIKQLRHYHLLLAEMLQKYLPDLRTDNLPIVVFPQMFLG